MTPTLPDCLRAKAALRQIGKNGAPGKDKSVEPYGGKRKSKHPPFPKPGKSGAPKKHGTVEQKQSQKPGQIEVKTKVKIEVKTTIQKR
jgi:hypothetical protein